MNLQMGEFGRIHRNILPETLIGNFCVEADNDTRNHPRNVLGDHEIGGTGVDWDEAALARVL